MHRKVAAAEAAGAGLSRARENVPRPGGERNGRCYSAASRSMKPPDWRFQNAA